MLPRNSGRGGRTRGRPGARRVEQSDHPTRQGTWPEEVFALVTPAESWRGRRRHG